MPFVMDSSVMELADTILLVCVQVRAMPLLQLPEPSGPTLQKSGT